VIAEGVMTRARSKGQGRRRARLDAELEAARAISPTRPIGFDGKWAGFKSADAE